MKYIKNKILLGIGLILSASIVGLAQQEIILTKYTYNSMFFNPAYVGSHGPGEGTVIVHHRNQWMQFDGAPTTILIGGETSLADHRVGVGFGVARESIGVESRFDVNANAAYRIHLGEGYLAAGLRVNFGSFRDDFSKLNVQDVGDVYDQLNYNFSVLNIGTGIYYNTNGLYLGVALPSLATITASGKAGDRAKHMYLHAGLMIGDDYATIKIEPSLLLKFQQATNLQTTLGANIWFSNDFAVGAHWRSDDALALSTEFHFMNDFRVAISYDFTTSEIRKYSTGSLELLLGYRFNTNKDNPRIKNLRHGGRF